MRVDGRPGLTLHRGPCRFWTAIIVAPNVVQLGFLFINKHFYFYSQTLMYMLWWAPCKVANLANRPSHLK